MDVFLTSILSSFSHFFSFGDFMSAITTPANLINIGVLVLLEGLLSADNALVLALLVKHLPKDQQKKALMYGIVGAYAFRFIAIGLGTYLVTITWVKLLGAAYLLWKTFEYFFGDAISKLFNSSTKEQEEEVDESKYANYNFWKTVIAVELMDIAFSVDSILAAFGISGEIWVLYLGGILGILMMRGVAQIFVSLIEKYPELEGTAYVLIGLIGVKMLLSGFGIHVVESLFYALLVLTFLSTFVIHYAKQKFAHVN